MIRQSHRVAFLVATLMTLVTAIPAGAEQAGVTPAVAHVTYLTGSSVYVDAGRQEGLLQGDEIQVVREGVVIATLRATFLSEHRAACSIVNASSTPAVGDLVRFTAHREAPPAGSKESEAGTPAGTPLKHSSSAGLFGSGIHGRVGVRYLEVRDATGNGGGFHQPAMDLRLDGYGLDGGPVDLSVDVRSRRTYRTASTGTAETGSDNRVYRASVGYHIDDRQQMVVGRQFAPALAVLSIFDGVLYSLDGPRAGWGVFSGVQPDPADLAFSTDISEHGAYMQFRSATDAARRWAVTTGLIGSYTQQTVNREFFYLQGQYFGSRLSGYLAQEVDYNTSWKVSQAGESRVSPTSTFANLQLRAGERVTFYAGYDNRRNVRLFRDRVTPASEFDDSHRQGGWAGLSLRLGDHWFTSADARSNSGGPSGSSDGYSASVGVDRLTRANLAVRGRSTRYTNDQSEGRLDSVSAGVDLAQRMHLELSGGRLQETNLTDSTLDRNADWLGLDLDLLLGRSWFWLLSGERNHGNLESNDQIYTGVTYRF